MKKFFLLLALLSLPAIVFAGPIIEFSETVHDFGDIRRGTQVRYDFKYRNTGNEELVIKAIEPS